MRPKAVNSVRTTFAREKRQCVYSSFQAFIPAICLYLSCAAYSQPSSRHLQLSNFFSLTINLVKPLTIFELLSFSLLESFHLTQARFRQMYTKSLLRKVGPYERQKGLQIPKKSTYWDFCKGWETGRSTVWTVTPSQ
jgi:hypothetical protein